MRGERIKQIDGEFAKRFLCRQTLYEYYAYKRNNDFTIHCLLARTEISIRMCGVNSGYEERGLSRDGGSS